MDDAGSLWKLSFEFLLNSNKILGISESGILMEGIGAADDGPFGLFLFDNLKAVDSLWRFSNIWLAIVLRGSADVAALAILFCDSALVEHDHKILEFLLEEGDDFVLARDLSPEIKNLWFVGWLLFSEQIGAEGTHCGYSFGCFHFQFVDLFWNDGGSLLGGLVKVFFGHSQAAPDSPGSLLDPSILGYLVLESGDDGLEVDHNVDIIKVKRLVSKITLWKMKDYYVLTVPPAALPPVFPSQLPWFIVWFPQANPWFIGFLSWFWLFPTGVASV